MMKAGRAWRPALPWEPLSGSLLLVVDRHVVELPAASMRALLRERQRLAVFRDSAHRSTDSRARFRLGAVSGQRIDAGDGHHIEVRAAAGRVGFAVLFESQISGGVLSVRRRCLYCHRYALCGFSVNSRLA